MSRQIRKWTSVDISGDSGGVKGFDAARKVESVIKSSLKMEGPLKPCEKATGGGLKFGYNVNYQLMKDFIIPQCSLSVIFRWSLEGRIN